MLALRATARADLAAVTAWEAEPDTACWLGDTGPAWHGHALSDPTQEHLIALRAGVPVGFAVLARVPGPSVELRRVVLAAEHRGSGHGRALLRALLARAATVHGATEVWLDVKADNTRARALYAANGFTVSRAIGQLIFLSRPVAARSPRNGDGPHSR